MRIDDENKVVWCSEAEMSWYVSFNSSVGNTMIGDMRRIAHLSTDKEMIMRFNVDKNTRFKMISAIVEGYEFRLEQPQKYYWRKKKEHLAWFESEEHSYLAVRESSGSISLHNIVSHKWQNNKFIETEAHDLLKDDFDKFEKVEC